MDNETREKQAQYIKDRLKEITEAPPDLPLPELERLRRDADAFCKLGLQMVEAKIAADRAYECVKGQLTSKEWELGDARETIVKLQKEVGRLNGALSDALEMTDERLRDENAQGFRDYQDLKIVNGMLRAEIEELKSVLKKHAPALLDVAWRPMTIKPVKSSWPTLMALFKRKK